MGPCSNLDIARSYASMPLGYSPVFIVIWGWYGCLCSCLQYLGMCDIACTKVIARSRRSSAGRRKGHGGVALVVFRPTKQHSVPRQ